MRWRDRVIGVILGLVLGFGVLILFVFVFSERTVDAPSLSGNEQPGRGERESRNAEAGPAPVSTVRVVNGRPPGGGPAELGYQRNDLVRLRVVSDTDVGLRLPGYGIERAVAGGGATTIRFTASRAGSFPLLVAASNIAVARITVD